MKNSKRQRFAARIFVLAVVLLTPLAARADDNAKIYDARLQGYSSNVTQDNGGTALTYFLLVGLSVVALGVLFKNARRTHLD